MRKLMCGRSNTTGKKERRKDELKKKKEKKNNKQEQEQEGLTQTSRTLFRSLSSSPSSPTEAPCREILLDARSCHSAANRGFRARTWGSAWGSIGVVLCVLCVLCLAFSCETLADYLLYSTEMMMVMMMRDTEKERCSCTTVQ